jgi:predicted enzyme related to lactoylglutathione lyase
MDKENTIDYLELPATDIPKTQAFFQELFGWKFTDYGPEYCCFNDGSSNGGFYLADEVAGPGKGAPLLVLYKADLEGTQEAVKQAGGEIVKQIFDFPGGRRFHFTDPNGNELAVWSDK